MKTIKGQEETRQKVFRMRTFKDEVESIFKATERGDYEQVKSLWKDEYEIDINETTLFSIWKNEHVVFDRSDPHRKTLLDIACDIINPELIKFFIEKGADANYIADWDKGSIKWTTFDYVLKRSAYFHKVAIPVEAVKILLDNGVKPTEKQIEFICINYSLRPSDIDILKLFLEYGVDPNLKVSNHFYSVFKEKSLLEFIIKSAYNDEVKLEGIKLLLQYGANPDTLNQDGKILHEDSGVGENAYILEFESAFIKGDYSKLEFTFLSYVQDFVKWKLETQGGKKYVDNHDEYVNKLQILNKYIESTYNSMNYSLKNWLERQIKGFPTLKEIIINNIDVTKFSEEENAKIVEKFFSLPEGLQETLYNIMGISLTGDQHDTQQVE